MDRGNRNRARLQVVILMALPGLAVGVLHRLGSSPWLRVEWDDLGSWLDRTPLEDLLASSLRYVALGIAYWLVLSTAAYLAALASGRRRWVEGMGRLTLPIVRRITEKAVAGSLVLSTLAAPLVGHGLNDQTPPPGATVATDYLPFESVSLPGPHQPPDLSRFELGFWEPGSQPEISIRLDASLEVVVRPGDHLWALAERRMAEVLGRPVQDHEIAPYWLRVIDANRGSIRSGNPDLIYPGEVIVLPALDL